jgi:hypothetical protein
MAYEQGLRSVGVPSSADLTSGGTVDPQFLFVSVNANGQIALTGAGACPDGVVQDKPNAQGYEAQVGILGVTKLITGAAVNAGDPLMPNANGQAITWTAGNWVRARALAASSGAGIAIPALLMGPYYK